MRLNSYSRQHALYQTLKAFGQIIKSIFILRYIDDLELRQAIEKQLNKIELANRFTRAVAVGDPRGFTQAEKGGVGKTWGWSLWHALFFSGGAAMDVIISIETLFENGTKRTHRLGRLSRPYRLTQPEGFAHSPAF